MLIDSRLVFEESKSVTIDADAADLIDLGVDHDIGVGRPMYCVVAVEVAADDTTGDETYAVIVETDDNTSFTSATDICTVNIPRGSAAGTVFWGMLNSTNERYIRVRYDVGGTTPTVTVTSWLSDQEPQAWRAYADAI